MKEKTLKISPEVIHKKMANGDVMLARMDDAEEYFTITGPSASIWNSLSSGLSLTEAEEAFLKMFPKDQADAKKHFKKFIADLRKNKFIA